MEKHRSIAGPGASAIKYDVLTALLVLSTRGTAVEARLAVRLSLLITARFNWRRGSFSVGQREMARMWGVTERTAKREMAQMRALQWIEVSVPAARGRVAEHRILFEHVLADTRPHWAAVGPDFEARMANAPEATEGQGATNVVPLRRQVPAVPTGTLWGDVASRLEAEDPAVFSAWFSVLTEVAYEGGVLRLAAPSKFHADYVCTHFTTRLWVAATAQDRGVRVVEVGCWEV